MPPWRNWLAHPPSKREVAGSIPVGGIVIYFTTTILRSLVVRICRFHRQGRGSIPREGVICAWLGGLGV